MKCVKRPNDDANCCNAKADGNSDSDGDEDGDGDSVGLAKDNACGESLIEVRLAAT